MKIECNFQPNPRLRSFVLDVGDGGATRPPQNNGDGGGGDRPNDGGGLHGVPRPLKNGGVSMRINTADVMLSWLTTKVDEINAAQSEEQQLDLLDAFPEPFKHLLVTRKPDLND